MRRPRHGHTAPTTSSTPWQDDAACRDVDTEVFFPITGKSAAAAKTVCARCPVQGACLEHALAVGERHGVWGGATEDERRTIRRRRERPERAA